MWVFIGGLVGNVAREVSRSQIRQSFVLCRKFRPYSYMRLWKFYIEGGYAQMFREQ